MIGGSSYQAAHLPFVIHGPARGERARAPPERQAPGTHSSPDTPKGQRKHPPALANHDPNPVPRTEESRYDLPYIPKRNLQYAIAGERQRGCRPQRRDKALSGGGPVTALYCIAWAVIAAVSAWAITAAHASAVISRLQAEMRKEIAYWQDETSRARVHAAQIARDTAIRADAWKDGRDDVIAIMPLIAAAHGASSYSQDGADEETQTR